MLAQGLKVYPEIFEHNISQLLGEQEIEGYIFRKPWSETPADSHHSVYRCQCKQLCGLPVRER